jgi:hypothetical protein
MKPQWIWPLALALPADWINAPEAAAADIRRLPVELAAPPRGDLSDCIGNAISQVADPFTNESGRRKAKFWL